MRHPLPLLSSVLLATIVTAQDNLGILANTGASYSARGVGFNAAALRSIQFNRIDASNHGTWGWDDNNLGTRNFTGLHFRIQDFDQSTADTFRLVAYTENAIAPDYPDTAAPLVTTGPVSMPIGPTGLGAFDATANFATPITAPAWADVFVGLSQDDVVNALGTDGMTVWLTTAESGPWPVTVRDIPGAGAPTAGVADTFAGFIIPQASNAPSYVPRAQFHIEPITTSAAGVASALHYNDSWHVDAGAVPGTSCMLSSVSPDARIPALNPGRADDLGMTFRKTGIPDQSPVFWVAQVARSLPPELPLSLALPGAVGGMGIDPGTAVVLGFSPTTSGVASNLIVFPAGLRPLLGSFSIVQQAVAYDLANGTFVAGPTQISTL